MSWMRNGGGLIREDPVPCRHVSNPRNGSPFMQNLSPFELYHLSHRLLSNLSSYSKVVANEMHVSTSHRLLSNYFSYSNDNYKFVAKEMQICNLNLRVFKR